MARLLDGNGNTARQSSDARQDCVLTQRVETPRHPRRVLAILEQFAPAPSPVMAGGFNGAH